MANQLTSNAEALRLFFTDEVFLVKDAPQATYVEPVAAVKPTTAEPLPSIQVTSAETPQREKLQQVAKSWEFSFLGKNQKRILILVNDADNPVSTKEGTELLRNLVKAIGLTNNDFALVNYAPYDGAKFNDLQQFFKPELVLSFGVGHSQLDLSAQPLHQLSLLETTKLIFTHNLSVLHQDHQSKKVLWSALQQIKS